MTIKVSDGNAKLGAIKSISLPSGVTCRNDCECRKKCYARRLERRRPGVRNAYATNYSVLLSQPEVFWREVEATIMMSRFFRFHVSGDIPDSTYFQKMVDIAGRNPHCEILCFTKKYDIVNSFLSSGGEIPANLHMIFSGWRGLKMDNPYRLPEAHVRYSDGTTTARSDAQECSGNCTDCAITDSKCWSLGRNEQVVFKEH